MSTDPIFSTLGLFIIDENRYPESSGRPSEHDIIGGGGSYAVLGARMVAGAERASRITGIIDKGRDFPDAVQRQLETWGAGWVFKEDPTRLTSRGANIYDENDVRHFEYTTPKKRVEVGDILDAGLGHSHTVHYCCAMDRFGESADTINEYSRNRPLHIFEPTPDACTAANLGELTRVLPKADVFTPNLNEACELVGAELPTTAEDMDQLASVFFRNMKPLAGVVLRCGPLGCYIKTKDISQLLPAYHQDQTKVVDVTGAGNAFCGAFVTALHLHKDWLLAGAYGNVVSGCVIEHLGVAELGPHDVWNGLSVGDRLAVYALRQPN